MKSRNAIHVEPGEGRALWVSCELITCKVPSEQTGGAYSLFEIMSHPQGGVPPHIQHREDECFYVLEGEFEFLVEDLTTRMGVGSLLYVPRGNLHAYKNVGDKPARMLVSQTPGGLHERFFKELGKPVEDPTASPIAEGPQGDEKLSATAAKYGIEIRS
jgi:mannose-6-phosphate isomerase-like protein (cupin superfamily)